MITKEFHDEAAVDISQSRLRNISQSNEFSCEATASTITPLLLRLQLNGWITSNDKIFLDTLAPSHSLTFLIKNRTYIHPEDLSLFKFDVIESAVEQGGDAVFTHRCQPDNYSNTNYEYKIFTTIINPQADEKVILGFFGPEHHLNKLVNKNKFIQLMTQFKRSYQHIEKDIDILNNSLNSTLPTILVNLTLVQVLAINSMAGHLLSKSKHELLDLNYDQIQNLLASLWQKHKIQIKNINVDGYEISIISLLSFQQTDKSDTGILPNLIKTIEMHLSNIINAASNIKYITKTSLENNDRYNSLTDKILFETKEIENTLSQITSIPDSEKQIINRSNSKTEKRIK